MGRRKRQAFVSYVDIVVSTYVKKGEYERAQINYVSKLGSKRDFDVALEDLEDVAFDSEEEFEGD